MPGPGKKPQGDVVVRGVWKGLEKVQKTGSAGSVNLQKSNRGETLNDEGGKKGILIFPRFQGYFFRTEFFELLSSSGIF